MALGPISYVNEVSYEREAASALSIGRVVTRDIERRLDSLVLRALSNYAR